MPERRRWKSEDPASPGPHPAARLFPLFARNELHTLATDIRTHGLREPIVLYQGHVLDGRNRLQACEMAGVEPTFVTIDEDEQFDPVAYVLSANLHRRHLNESQRAMVAAKLADAYAEQARQRSNANLRRGHKRPDRANLRNRRSTVQNGKTSAVAGTTLAVGSRSIEYAQTVLRRGSPELVELVERGELSVSRAAKIAREVTPAEQHTEVMLRRTRPELRDAVLQVMANSGWRTRDEIVAAVRATGLTGVPDNEIHCAILAASRRHQHRRLQTDDHGNYRLIFASPEQRTAVELYRELVNSLDELDQIARSFAARGQYPQLQPLARRMRERALEAIEAIAADAAHSHEVPTYVAQSCPIDRPERQLIRPEKIKEG
ncbi:MAG: ParB N-terminal domain-containing protein [Pirellulales bacterium]